MTNLTEMISRSGEAFPRLNLRGKLMLKKIREVFFIPYIHEVDLEKTKAKFKVEGTTSESEAKNLGREAAFIKEVIDNLRDGDEFFDIGSRHGLFSILAVLSKNIRVNAFEPDPENISLFQKNLKLNKIDENLINIQELAITDVDGNFQLASSGSEGKSPRLQIVKMREVDLKKYKKDITVKGISLDSLIEKSGGPIPDVIKIDIEGAEGHAIAGAKRLLSNEFGKRPRHIFLELHESLIPMPYTAAMIQETLNEYGYVLKSIEKRKSESLCHYEDSGTNFQ